MKKAFLALAAIGLMSSAALAVKGEVKVTGQGTIEPGRTFAISATLYPDGTASGQATLINKNFTGDSGKGPYKLRVDITCFKRLDANTVTLGGSTERTNDSSLVDAVFFTLQDNGNGNDKMSRAFFWDDDPDTQGDPAACQFVNAGDFPLEDVQQGNLNVK